MYEAGPADTGVEVIQLVSPPGDGDERPGASQVLDAADVLRQAIERESADLRRGVELYIYRFTAIRAPDQVAEMAAEVIQDVVVRALTGAQGFDPTRRALAWLLGIALNVVRERSRQHRREAQTRYQPVAPFDADPVPLEDVLARIHDAESTSAYGLIELLELVDSRDREVLGLAYVEGMRGPALAERLGVNEGAARVRLSRALHRLAAAYHQADAAGSPACNSEESHE